MRIVAAIYTAVSFVASAAAVINRHRSRAAWWVAVWCTSGIIGNLTSLSFYLRRQNNHWMNYVWPPMETLLVGAAAWWFFAGKPGWQRTAAVSAAVITLTGIVLALTVESFTTFSAYSEPLHKLYAGAMGIALVAASIRASDRSPMWNAAAWVGIGWVMIYIPTIAISPVARLIYGANPQASQAPLNVSFAIEILGLLMIAAAFVWRRVEWTR
ncbi:MAG: hypothetical protein H0W15_12250 [Gemmatimonadales bacterium]|nr:hypothetical protein [Gemmatimonadales bacterium]